MSAYEIFEKLCEEKGVKPYRVSKDTKIATATLSDWKNGKSIPKSDKMQTLADYFNVPVEYFTKGESDDISQSVRIRQVFESMLRLNGWEIEYYDPTEGKPCAECLEPRNENGPWWANPDGLEPPMLCDNCMIDGRRYIIRKGDIERVFDEKEYQSFINNSSADLNESLLQFNEDESLYSTYRIPVVRRVAAGRPVDATDEILGWLDIPEDLHGKGTFFGLQIRGDSMSPGIRDKDIVICRKQDDAESGEIVVVLIGDGNDGVCKRLKKYDDGSIVLISDNPLYEPIHCDANNIPHIRGVVKELRRRF